MYISIMSRKLTKLLTQETSQKKKNSKILIYDEGIIFYVSWVKFFFLVLIHFVLLLIPKIRNICFT